MSDAESNDTFELDDKRAEIVPAIQKSDKGNLHCVHCSQVDSYFICFVFLCCCDSLISLSFWAQTI